jgi:signal transduction histidine kinase
VLLDAVLRKVSHGEIPLPTVLPDLSRAALSHADLVQVRGVLRNESLSVSDPLLRLTPTSGPGCLVAWIPFLQASDFSLVENGSTVELTGILTVNRLQETGFTATLTPRNLADVKVLSGPAWWTRKRVLVALGFTGAIAFVTLGFTIASRWTIQRQRRQLSEIEARVIATEERRRISREFHDSLQQQLAAAALHLETIKGAVTAAPDLVARLVDDTSAMIRHCQVEARHCIWDLRTEMPVHEGLAEAVAEWLHVRSQQVKEPALQFIAETAIPPLSEDHAFQIMRITQEAVNNAIAHAHARNVSVRMRCCAEALEVSIRDDGLGFEPEHRSSRDASHFGLQSMNERAQKISADLSITSAANYGTQVSLRLPHAAPSRHQHAHPP